jgi:IclR family pca regulon transcriptional regulator
MDRDRSAYFSESLSRGLLVLRAFDRENPRLRVRDVSERTGLNRAAVRRFLLTLRDLGYVASENDVFFLRPRVLDLGYSYLASADIHTHIQPILEELVKKAHEASTLATLDGLDALVIARACRRTFDMVIGSGSRLSITRTALGVILLGDLAESQRDSLLQSLRRDGTLDAAGQKTLVQRIDRAKRDGYAAIDRVNEQLLASVAVPIRDRERQMVAALNVTSYAPRPKGVTLASTALDALYAAQSQIEAALRSSHGIPLMSVQRMTLNSS